MHLAIGRLGRLMPLILVVTAVAPAAAQVNGLAGSNISITLLMPPEVAMNGSTVMPLTSWKCVISNSPARTGTPVAFSPLVNVPMSATFQSSSGSVRMYIGSGATVHTVSGQANGSYSASGHMAIAYTDL